MGDVTWRGISEAPRALLAGALLLAGCEGTPDQERRKEFQECTRKVADIPGCMDAAERLWPRAKPTPPGAAS